MKIKEDEAKIVDVTRIDEYERLVYRCLAPMPFRKYRSRREYLERALPEGLQKKILIWEGQIVGQIEYSPAKASGYPMAGSNVVVMNCIWVLRKARGKAFGKLLLSDMVRSEKEASGFATIALENHWSPWFRKRELEKLGFMPIDSMKVSHTIKRRDHVFNIYLMWMPAIRNAKLPTWDKQELLKGETFCMAHPLYRPQALEGNILEARQ